MIVQKYVHDMKAWNALSTEDQEKVFGRTKLEDIEMPDDIKPTNSHLALNVIEDENGNELKILRDNMPFGTLGTVSTARTASRTRGRRTSLRNMFLGDPLGNSDRVLDFSTALTGCNFFVPTADFLDDPPDLPMATG